MENCFWTKHVEQRCSVWGARLSGKDKDDKKEVKISISAWLQVEIYSSHLEQKGDL